MSLCSYCSLNSFTCLLNSITSVFFFCFGASGDSTSRKSAHHTYHAAWMHAWQPFGLVKHFAYIRCRKVAAFSNLRTWLALRRVHGPMGLPGMSEPLDGDHQDGAGNTHRLLPYVARQGVSHPKAFFSPFTTPKSISSYNWFSPKNMSAALYEVRRSTGIRSI